MTPIANPTVENRGRVILVLGLLLIAGSFVRSTLRHLPQNSEEWVEKLISGGLWLSVLFFAYRGGNFSLAIIRAVLLLAGGVLLIVAAIVFFAPSGAVPVDLRAVLLSWRGMLLLTNYAFLFWVFFLSTSVRTYVRHRRTQA